MRIALVDSSVRGLYPISLLKLGAWRKALGDDCELFLNRLPAAGDFDEIWITTRFTFEIPRAVGMVREAKKRARRVWVGGIAATLLPEHFEAEGVDVHRGLLPEAEGHAPDYSLLGHAPKYSISYTSRGCVRKCRFCMVRTLEPEFFSRLDWEKDLHPGTKKVLFYDNNWLAKDFGSLKADVLKLRGLVAAGRVSKIDFNQGIDARLLTANVAELLAGLPIRPVRFAFDGMQEDGYYQGAVRLMARHGFNHFMTYVLYNFMDTPQDFYYRLRESVALTMELGVPVSSFPMRYQPIMDVDGGRLFVGRYWTQTKRKGFMAILSLQSTGGAISANSYDEFEYWFGRDAEEFDRLLAYPRLRELLKRKKGALRLKRAGAKDVY